MLKGQCVVIVSMDESAEMPWIVQSLAEGMPVAAFKNSEHAVQYAAVRNREHEVRSLKEVSYV